MNNLQSKKCLIKKENMIYLRTRFIDTIAGENLKKIIPVIQMIDEWVIKSIHYPAIKDSIVPKVNGKIELTAHLVNGAKNNREIYDPMDCGKTWFRYIMSPKNRVTWAPIDYMEVRRKKETMEVEIISVQVLLGKDRRMGCEKLIPDNLLGISEPYELQTIAETVKIGKLTVTP